VIESEDSPDEKHPYPATFAPGSAHIKGKKKKRTTSFSLPFHRRRRLSNASWVGYMKWYKGSQRSVFRWSIVGLLAAMLFIGIYLWRRSYELQVELSFFSHKWVKEEFDVVMPLRGCFDPAHISPLYDMEKHLAPKHQALTPGVSLKRGTACYDFSSTVQPVPGAEPEHLLYHTYWRSDLIPFGERHMATLQSFLATQPLSHSKLILWTNGMDVISNSTFVKPIVEKWGDNIEVRQVDMTALTKSTELAGLLSNADGGGLYDKRAWVDGDAVRLLVLWHYGGVWMDMDQILTRDLHPLVEHEFVTQWDCYGEFGLKLVLLEPPVALTPVILLSRGHLPSFRLPLACPQRLTAQTNPTSRSTALSCISANTHPTSAKPSTSWRPPRFHSPTHSPGALISMPNYTAGSCPPAKNRSRYYRGVSPIRVIAVPTSVSPTPSRPTPFPGLAGGGTVVGK